MDFTEYIDIYFYIKEVKNYTFFQFLYQDKNFRFKYPGFLYFSNQTFCIFQSSRSLGVFFAEKGGIFKIFFSVRWLFELYKWNIYDFVYFVFVKSAMLEYLSLSHEKLTISNLNANFSFELSRVIIFFQKIVKNNWFIISFTWKCGFLYLLHENKDSLEN